MGIAALSGRLRHMFGGAAPEALAERRDGLRVEQIARTITLLTAGVRIDFKLRNLSTRGCSGEAEVSLNDGAYVTLEFERGQEVAGVVKWTKESLVGIAFPSPVSLDIIRFNPNAADPKHERAPRYNVSRPATITLGPLSRAAVIRNISTTGMLVESAFTLQSGQRVRVSCGAMTLDCQVRWSRHGMAGLAFFRPISLDRFSDAEMAPDA